MKYLKTFEAPQQAFDRKFWLVKTSEPYLRLTLDNLNVPFSHINWIMSSIENSSKYYGKYIYLCCFSYKLFTRDSITETMWEFKKHDSLNKKNLLMNKYKYMGLFEVPLEDIEKWQLKQDVNRYNL